MFGAPLPGPQRWALHLFIVATRSVICPTLVGRPMAESAEQTSGSSKDPSRCALCGFDRPLVDSHIVPKFVWRFMRQTSPGLIRMASAPNQRRQDGYTLPLL